MSSADHGEFQRPAAPPPSAPPPPDAERASTAAGGRGYSIAGLILGILALFVVPIVLGPAGIALGYVGHRKGDRLGRTTMIVAAVGMVIGIVLGFLVFQQLGAGSS